MAIGISCQLWLARLPLPRLQIQSQRGLASLRRHSCLAGACGAMLSCGSLRLSFLSVRLPWWRWVQPSRVSSLTAPRSSFDCLASSTGAGTRESAHSQSNWCALNVCCRRGSAGLTDVVPAGLRDSICDTARPLTPRWWVAIARPTIRRAMPVSLPLQWFGAPLWHFFDASAVPQTWTDAKWQSILAYLRNGGR